MEHDAPYAGMDRLHDHVRRWAKLRPQAEAVVAAGVRLDYAALWSAVEVCAAAMVRRMNVVILIVFTASEVSPA